MKIRKNHKWVMVLCIGIITITGCKKSNTERIPSGENELLLSEIRLDDVLQQRLEYNDKNMVTKQLIYENDMHLLGSRTHVYNAENLLIRVIDEDTGSDVSYEDYTYDPQGKPLSGTITLEGKVIWNISFQVAKNKVSRSGVSIDGKTTSVSTLFFDDKGNLLKMDHLMNGAPMGTNEWFAYDDKKGAAGAIGDPVSMLFASPNNPTKERHTYPDRVVEYDLKYSYNDAGYPTKMERFEKDTDNLVDVSTYKYIAAN